MEKDIDKGKRAVFITSKKREEILWLRISSLF